MYKKVVKLDEYRPTISDFNHDLIIYGTNYTYTLPQEILEQYATGERAILTDDLLRAIVRGYLVMMRP